MSTNIRVPAEIYEVLRQIKVDLEGEYQSAAPTMQDLSTVALQHFIDDWSNPEKRKHLLEELLENRKMARTSMGKTKNR